MESPRADEVGRPVSHTRSLPPAEPRAVLDRLEAPRSLWQAPDGTTILAEGAAATLTADGPGRISAIRDAATHLFDRLEWTGGPEIARPRLFGGFAFHDDHQPAGDWAGLPSAQFVLPEAQVVLDGDDGWLTRTTVGPAEGQDGGDGDQGLVGDARRFDDLHPGSRGAPPGVTDRRRTTTLETWQESVEAAVARIRSGDLRKVVLAQALQVDLESTFSPADTLARLGETYPDCYRFLVDPPGESAFLGATPERLVSLVGRDVETGALAGTTGRGETRTEDDWLAEELLADEKNRHEHALVADAVREQLASLATSVTRGETGIRKLATVQHLYTPIDGTLQKDGHVLDLVEALHPTPAVGGLPPERALETIRETERFDRGWYAAPVGWVDAKGDGCFAVGIRSALARERAATLFAGVGIVGDSDPHAEWDEVDLKFRPILDALEREAD